MSVTNAIRVALENHLATTPNPALPAIAWPNVSFTPAPGTPYIRAEFIPTARRPSVIGPNPEQRIQGLFSLTVFTPEFQGAAAGMGIVDRLLVRFNGSSAIVAPTVTVRLEYSEARLPLHAPPFFAIPVEIGWYAYKP
jgi:hypothetical protein